MIANLLGLKKLAGAGLSPAMNAIAALMLELSAAERAGIEPWSSQVRALKLALQDPDDPLVAMLPAPVQMLLAQALSD